MSEPPCDLVTQSCPGILELACCVVALPQPLLVRREVNEGLSGVDRLALDGLDRSDTVIRCSPDSNDFALRLEPTARGHGSTCCRLRAVRTGTRGFLMRIDTRRAATGNKRVHGCENQKRDHDNDRAR